MQARFLLGPAGSGKTVRCLAEIRAELLKSPLGPPLILLAPKQATFQLERQLLADGSLAGYTRLQILSFERLARFVLDALDAPPPRLLDEEGRLMVLRALLAQKRDELKLFRASARLPGFARQLSLLLRELQQHQLSPEKLAALAGRADSSPPLRDKLHDVAVLLRAYLLWLREHDLQDADGLLDVAADAARSTPAAGIRPLAIQGLWLDGFAEMTPQELDLLAAVVPRCEHATLAFCLETAKVAADGSWLSIWSVVGRTFRRCQQRMSALREISVVVEELSRSTGPTRYTGSPALQHLEANWTRPRGFTIDDSQSRSPIRLVACADPEVEATFAAREIHRFARGGGRYREVAVLVRSLEAYHKPLARVFRRYGIPFFLDQREPVSHHPLAELTRSAVRLVAFDWPHEDWFAALKSGFAPVDETEIDRLENAALEFGWVGKRWREPLPDASSERLRRKILPPFENFVAALSAKRLQPSGAQLAESIRELWEQLRVERTLEQWSAASADSPDGEHSALHQTLWDQMNLWLDNVALAFPREPLPLRDWLPILEAGLANLTVGVIPPALDQVLIGAIDRSRNPDLKLAILPGFNESVFPAAPTPPNLLNEADRAGLRALDVPLGADERDRLAQERYYGYIACTRARERLVLTCSRHDADGRTLNPSPFIAHLQRLFPNLATEKFQPESDWREAEHVSELAARIVEIQNAQSALQDWSELVRLPEVAALSEGLRRLRNPDPAERLSPALAEKLYGPTLRTSVSRVEQFAACPFRFFVHSGLRAEERKLFELDVREQGSFQHEVLARFHEQLRDEGRRWRDLTPPEARERVGKVAAAMMADYREGLLQASEQSRFTARVLADSLQNFVEVSVGWMRGQYDFDPAGVELEFGGHDAGHPAWELDLGGVWRLALRGRIDRVDLFRDADSEEALCVVIDYKSSRKQLDPVLVAHGVQLQLLAYLSVLRHWPDPRPLFGAPRLVPAGVFYVNLRGRYERSENRADALADAEVARKLAYRHAGRFDVSALGRLDRLKDARKAGDQFNYRLKNDGSLWGRSAEALAHAEFETLLNRVETQLQEMGRAIFLGEAGVDPYRKGSTTACDQCDYRPICRIDPWTHRYRVLRKAGEEAQAG